MIRVIVKTATYNHLIHTSATVIMTSIQPYTGLLLVAFQITAVTCARSKLFVCPEIFLLSWQELPPYTHITNGTPSGILFDTFKKGKRKGRGTG